MRPEDNSPREAPTANGREAYSPPRAQDIDTTTGPTEAAAIVANSGQKPPP
jgi:hypothetical protein